MCYKPTGGSNPVPQEYGHNLFGEYPGLCTCRGIPVHKSYSNVVFFILFRNVYTPSIQEPVGKVLLIKVKLYGGAYQIFAICVASRIRVLTVRASEKSKCIV